MENVNPMSVPRAEAETAYRQYVEALRKKRTEFLHDMKVAYGHMRNGRGILDVWDAFAKTGLNGDHDPKVAIAPITASRVFFVKEHEQDGWRDDQWVGRFTPDLEINRRRKRFAKRLEDGEVYVPHGTYGPLGSWQWSYRGETTDAQGVRHVSNERWQHPVLRGQISAVVPTIPARFIPDAGVTKRLYVLWEVDKWTDHTPPGRDPILLSRVNANTFAVLAAWDITDVERAVLRGRLV